MSNQHKEKSGERASTIAREAHSFREQFQSVQLATCSADNKPCASYAPYVLDDSDCLGILTSRLAKHTTNLLRQTTAMAFFIENEAEARSVFARRRLSLLCTIQHHSRDSDFFSWLKAAMTARFGTIAEQLFQLGDFEAFRLEPLEAEYVKGFGSAWRFEHGQLREAALIRPNGEKSG